MELKRMYTYSPTLACRFKVKFYDLYIKLRRNNNQLPQIEPKIRKNNWLEKNTSLTGLYHLFSNYGESIVKPTIIGAITVGLSTLFWLIQNNPTVEPSLSFIAKNTSHFIANNSSHMYNITSNFINLTQIWNNTHSLKAFERSLADFLPLLSLPGDIKVGVIDYPRK
jgi:hypothetical protein